MITQEERAILKQAAEIRARIDTELDGTRRALFQMEFAAAVSSFLVAQTLKLVEEGKSEYVVTREMVGRNFQDWDWADLDKTANWFHTIRDDVYKRFSGSDVQVGEIHQAISEQGPYFEITWP